jgi:hypothetical protein
MEWIRTPYNQLLVQDQTIPLKECFCKVQNHLSGRISIIRSTLNYSFEMDISNLINFIEEMPDFISKLIAI